MTKTPSSMVDELGRWNNGAGIDLEGYISGEGSFSLAVGYSTFFWPDFVEYEGYILREGFCETSLRSFENGRTRANVEWLINHRHLADLHVFHPDASKDKLAHLGKVLREIHLAKLQWQFPDRPCVVELLVSDDEHDLGGYQLSFWQKSNEAVLTGAKPCD